MVYHAMQNYPLALEYYEAYLKRSAPQVAVYRAIAHIKHVHLNQVEQAIDVLDQALAKFPFDNTVLHDKFLIYECVDKLGSYTKTLWNVMLDGTALSHQNVIKNLYAYAYCLTYQNQIDQAMVYYQKILQKNPYQYQTLGQLGYIYYNKAIDSYKKYVELEQEQRVRDTTSALVIHGMHAHQKEVYPLNFQDYISQNPLISLKPKYIEPSVLGLTEDSVYLFRPTYIGIRTLGFLKLLTFHNIFYIANLYNGLQQDSSLWTYHTLCVYSMQLKQQLQEAVSYFQKVYKQNKQDKVLLKALYYSYYYLNKKNAASRMYRLVNQDLGKEDDPFED